MVPVEIKTLVVVKPPNPSFIILKPESDKTELQGKVVPIWIGYAEAVCLGVALESKRFERPLTHDLILDMMTSLDGRIDRVDITRVQKATFFSRITMHQYDRELTVDARPSDALALAVRQAAPIYIDEEIIKQVGCTFTFTAKKGSAKEAEELKAFQQFLSTITPDDFA